MIIFGTLRSTRVSPNEAELLQENVCCRMMGCGGRVNAFENNSHFHICFIPLFLLDTRNFVRCQRCSTTVTLLAQMGPSVRAKRPNIPMAKAKMVYMQAETQVSGVEMGVHDESLPILEKLKEGDGERAASVSEDEQNKDGTIMVEAADATIV